jgi:hypothetical protein
MEQIFWIAVAPLALIAIFYWPGRIILRLLTKGRYPPAGKEDHDVELVALIALAILLITISIYKL